MGASQRHAKTNRHNASDPSGCSGGLALPSLQRHSHRDTTARSQARRHPCDRRRNDHHADQSVSASSAGLDAIRAEVNAVCSMPDLPNWPDYDNIYGRWLESGEAPGAEGGNTDWQLLIYFDGTTQNKGGEEAPPWAQRLAQNACRKGDFSDN